MPFFETWNDIYLTLSKVVKQVHWQSSPVCLKTDWQLGLATDWLVVFCAVSVTFSSKVALILNTWEWTLTLTPTNISYLIFVWQEKTLNPSVANQPHWKSSSIDIDLNVWSEFFLVLLHCLLVLHQGSRFLFIFLTVVVPDFFLRAWLSDFSNFRHLFRYSLQHMRGPIIMLLTFYFHSLLMFWCYSNTCWVISTLSAALVTHQQASVGRLSVMGRDVVTNDQAVKT